MVDTAVILAAGLGIRLKDSSLNSPKAFLKIGGKSLLERSVKALVQNGIREIIIGTGFLAESFEAFAHEHPTVDIKCIKNEKYENTGSMLTLFCLRNYISKPFLLLESDLLYEDRAIKMLQAETKENIILASGFTGAGDEVFIQANSSGYLEALSKNRNELSNVSSELVGINKLSLEAYSAFCEFFKNHYNSLQNSHYESAFSCLAPEHLFFVLKQDNLIWCEIDNRKHLTRAHREIFPLLVNLESGSNKQERNDTNPPD